MSGITYRSVCELVQGGVVDCADLLGSPVGAGSGCGCSLNQNAGDAAGDRGSTGRTLDSPVGPPDGPGQGPGEVEGHGGGIGRWEGREGEKGKKEDGQRISRIEEVMSRSDEKRGRRDSPA